VGCEVGGREEGCFGWEFRVTVNWANVGTPGMIILMRRYGFHG
jgi:hypothetical protein